MIVELSIVDALSTFDRIIVELSKVELSIVESVTTVEQFITVELVMEELSEIDELSIVEFSCVELSRKKQLPVMTGKFMLFSSSVEYG